MTPPAGLPNWRERQTGVRGLRSGPGTVRLALGARIATDPLVLQPQVAVHLRQSGGGGSFLGCGTNGSLL